MGIQIFQPNNSGPAGSASPILLGDIFWSTSNTPTPGKLYGGQTYSWIDNPNLKDLFDAQGHEFITDNGATFTVLEYNGFIRGISSGETPGEFGRDVVTAEENVDNEVRVSYFGIYGDLAVVAVDTSLANQGTLADPAADEFATTLDVSDALDNVSTENIINLVSGDNFIDPSIYKENVYYVGIVPPGGGIFNLVRSGGYLLYAWKSNYLTVANNLSVGTNTEISIFIRNNSIYVHPLPGVLNSAIPTSTPASTIFAPSANRVQSFVLARVSDEADLREAGDEALQTQIDTLSLSSGGGAKTNYADYTFLGQLNFSDYLFLGAQNYKPSGSASNGFQFQNCIPYLVPFTGTLQKAVLRARGVAVGTAGPAATLTIRFGLWNVGLGNEGTKLTDLNFTYTITPNTGNFNNSAVDTNLFLSRPFSVPVTEGMLLGLKFDPITGSSNGISSFHTAFISLEFQEVSP